MKCTTKRTYKKTPFISFLFSFFFSSSFFISFFGYSSLTLPGNLPFHSWYLLDFLLSISTPIPLFTAIIHLGNTMNAPTEPHTYNTELKLEEADVLVEEEDQPKILDRSLFTKKEYMFLIVGYGII